MGLPVIELNSILDEIVRKNFQRLKDFFSQETPLLGFRHFEITFTQAVNNLKFPHNLGFLPKDVLLTSIIGAGSVIFNYNLFTSTEMDITVTGSVTSAVPTTVRFFAGTNSGG